MTQFGCILDQSLLNNETVYVMCFNSFKVIFDRSGPDYLYYVLICKTFDFKEGVLSFYYDWTINIMFLMCLQYKELWCGHCDKDT